jgi:transducin (beta)-like 1
MEAPPIRITADEINCLIYSYFKDSGICQLAWKSRSGLLISLLGFTHSAFTLCNEGALQRSSSFGKHIPRGELVDLLSKALLYLEVECHWRGNEMTTNCKNKFSLLEHHVCSSEASTSASLKSPVVSSAAPRLIPAFKVPVDKTPSSGQDVSTPRDMQIRPLSNFSNESIYGTTSTIQRNGNLTPNDAATKRKVSPIQIDGPAEKRAKREPDDMDVDVPTINNTRPSMKVVPAQQTSRPYIVPRKEADGQPVHALTSTAIMMLSGHRTEVFVCSFNPVTYTQLATGYA